MSLFFLVAETIKFLMNSDNEKEKSTVKGTPIKRDIMNTKRKIWCKSTVKGTPIKRDIMNTKRKIWCICSLIEKSHMTKLISNNAVDNQVSQMESILIFLLILSEAVAQRFLLKKRLRHRCFHVNVFM